MTQETENKVVDVTNELDPAMARAMAIVDELLWLDKMLALIRRGRK